MSIEINGPICVIGDLMLDVYLEGNTTRISPEAPVPVVKIEEESSRVGGAGNVAQNLCNLGCKYSLIGGIGNDEAGTKLTNLLGDKDTHRMLTSDVVTTVKTRIMAMSQQLLRIDKEEMWEWTDELLAKLKNQINDLRPGAIIISDYQKGFINYRSMSVIQAMGITIPIFVDPKGIEWAKYGKVEIIKPNLKELAQFLNRPIANTDNAIEKALNEAKSKVECQTIIVTRGYMGMSMISGNEVKHYPTEKTDVYDVTGAGDTVIAVLTYLLKNKYSLHEAIRLANKASGYVITKPKTYAISEVELAKLMM